MRRPPGQALVMAHHGISVWQVAAIGPTRLRSSRRWRAGVIRREGLLEVPSVTLQ
jgi:hypothetical protein